MYVVIEILQTLFYLFYCYAESVIRYFVPVQKKSFAGKLVLVTGAGHGIGRHIAKRFSEIGARLVLLDINKVSKPLNEQPTFVHFQSLIFFSNTKYMVYIESE